MKILLSLLLFFLTASLPQAQAQEFDRLYTKSVQPALSQPLQWASALASAEPNLPEAFVADPQVWAFTPYTRSTVLPTSTGRGVWVQVHVGRNANAAKLGDSHPTRNASKSQSVQR